VQISRLLSLALQHHQQGRLAEADALYRQVLAIDPRQADALHLLGVLALQAGRAEQAVDLIGEAIAINRATAEYHFNHGLALRAARRIDDAVTAYRRAVALKPDYPQAWNNLGSALKDRRDLDEAVAAFGRALALKPDHADAHNNLGVVLRAQNRLEDAIASWRRTLALRPNDVRALSNLGLALQDHGHLDEAVATCRRALALKPDLAGAHSNLAMALHYAEQPTWAIIFEPGVAGSTLLVMSAGVPRQDSQLSHGPELFSLASCRAYKAQHEAAPQAQATQEDELTAYEADTVLGLFERHPDGAVAIGAPDRPSLTYQGLKDLVRDTVAQLNAMGIGRNDRVAIVLPNGPEMAASFVAIACGATTAPLNPAYRADEFDFYLSDLDAKALVILEGMDSPARIVAAERNIPIVELTVAAGAPAGRFTLVPPASLSGTAAHPGLAQPQDVALVLHTSGTTARPKIVPLNHTNVSASAQNIARTLRLTPDDACLNIMPLFHIHGLIAATLSSLGAGASVHCTPGFNAFKFFGWFNAIRPSWYTAVPTMHQAILGMAARQAGGVDKGRLRFIRSSSASLPPQVMTELESTFGVPVIEAYGMTEASHQMASNPLPPAPHYAGSVGIAAGPEIAIMDEAGVLLAAGAFGEVVIRGRNVTLGYENNPEANAKSFTSGWFRTGDQGYLDETGYLRLTGRLKELINRGGEKVSPLEVDTILMAHPAVGQVVTFAMPHDKLGEEVAAAVVLKRDVPATEQELRDFASARLAAFKVPRKILFLEEIPKGATGKLQRIGLAQKLGLTA